MKISRRLFLVFLLALSLLSFSAAKDSATAGKYLLYIGTYTDKDSKGIYVYTYDEAGGTLAPLGIATLTTNPSFLAIHPNGKFLYAVNEMQNYKGEPTGAISAYSIDHHTGKLTLLNETASRGADPCYISFDRSGKFALVANYTGGTVAVFPLSADGKIGEATSAVKDAGTLGPNKERQDAPHAHWIEVSERNRYAYVADLGLDRVLIYNFDAAKGTLTASETAAKAGHATANDFFSADAAPGTGPRHIAFSHDGNFMYVLGELDSTVTVFANDKNEKYRSIQKTSALPAGFSGPNDAAEIAMHPNGKFLYTSNRGNDSIAVFAVDQKTGKLTLTADVPTQGKTPRHFEVDPTGTRLFVANQESGTIVVFAIDASSGRLSPTSQTFKVPSPVCLKFVKVE